VAVAAAPLAGLPGPEAARAGVAIGPRAVAKASNRAIVLLGASEVFSFSNMIFLRPDSKAGAFASPDAGTHEGQRSIDLGEGNITGPCFTAIARMLNESECVPGLIFRAQRGAMTILCEQALKSHRRQHL
jgi:hypothetical protein